MLGRPISDSMEQMLMIFPERRLDHPLDDLPGYEEQGRQVGVDDLPPIRFIECLKRGPLLNTGIIHQNVDGANILSTTDIFSLICSERVTSKRIPWTRNPSPSRAVTAF